MPTAAEGNSTLSRITLEALLGAAIVTIAAVVIDPTAPGRGSAQPHLLWLAVLVLAAHDGVRGLIASLVASVGALALASVCVGEDLGWMAERAQATSEILAFIGAVTVAWVVGGHIQRKQRIADALAARSMEAMEAHTAFGELSSVADTLARRADRAQLSVSYLRSIAERIDHGEPQLSADAALELALGRIDARVGAILLHDGTRLRLFAHRGVWSADRLLPPDVFQDRTAEQAFALAAPMTCAAFDTIAELDSDVAVPILDKNGLLLGVLAVRGLTFDLQTASIARYQQTLHELVAIARWVSRALAMVSLAPAPTLAPSTAYSFSFRAGERCDVMGARRAARGESSHVA